LEGFLARNNWSGLRNNITPDDIVLLVYKCQSRVMFFSSGGQSEEKVKNIINQ